MDRGFSWVICGAAFIIHALTSGFSFSIGVYYAEFLYVFNESKGTTAWISSLNLGTFCGVAPLASVIIHRLGYRVTMFAGGIIAATGLLICVFAENIYVVLLSLGFMMGLGSGLAYMSAVGVICEYFVHYRPLAQAIAMSGAGIGNILFPWITSSLMRNFGWRGTLLVSSGIALHMCVCATLTIRPLTRRKSKDYVSCEEHKKDSKMELNKGIHQTNVDNSNETDGDVSDNLKHITTNLFTNTNFIMLLLSSVMFIFGAAVILTHIRAFAESRGIPKSLENTMISVIGFSFVIGRVILGFLSQQRKVNTFVLYVAAIFICGSSIIGLALWSTPVGMMICSCVFGFFAASFGPTSAEVTFLTTGPKHFNFGFAFVLVSHALGWLLGPPASGSVRDVTHHYPDSFYLGGGVTVLAALVLIPLTLKSHTSKIIEG